MKLKKYSSTRTAAKLIGVHHLTLHKWLRRGLVKCNFTLSWDGRKLYRWSPEDIERLREYKTQYGGRWPRDRKT